MGISTAVLGLGNILLGDEGVGVHAVRELMSRYAMPEGVSVIDGGTMGLDLLPYIEGRERLLMVDAVNFGAPPGTIRVIEGADIRAFLSTKISVHQIGVPDMLASAELMGITPPVMALVGVQPESLETGVGLSPTLEHGMDDLLGVIVKKLGEWHVPCDTL